jgi:hypothetical protein
MDVTCLPEVTLVDHSHCPWKNGHEVSSRFADPQLTVGQWDYYFLLEVE